MSARDSVIRTPELVERTLVLLPVRDLLVIAPLVSKIWQAITLSPTLQRALFFEADPTASASQPVKNPLLVELFPPFFAPNTEETYPWPGTATSILAMPWAQAPEAFKRADASWRRMLVMQPPVQTMVVVQTSHGMIGTSERRAVVRDLSLRMGMLYDLAVPFLRYGQSSFQIKWNNGIAREGDITFMLSSSSSCVVELDPKRVVDERFDSVGGSKVKINYGEWVHLWQTSYRFESA
ncbi:hypothetical protein C8F04DRAFT_1102705 [Mycena alexandri]|uniref:F-box domain-containing protein n=1 Tax=Mycena alexandri TaxID=1745969 RepID=A0AAD6SUC9_9AGAR|nr:hypothetical protein C8F04DRAFT_1102705 [Mycena alexandri]